MTRIENDTIFAIASGAGRAAITVLRLSGRANAEAEFWGPPEKPGESARV